ncbi:H/ACA ribonucleoprotein complex subunit GAR1 [Haloprofundus halobius]|uniref:H/ACA ribonucleoprotein complex subunit GAR1 n=1 Tax=Haloprofundus halobius TaxID=2876194 RepID=UPI001CCF6912|nr:Gar1/Naf1 family protein [Haloprofundus halobius]
MQRVGTVSRTAQGLAIVRWEGDEDPRIGTSVVDESLSSAGRIVDVFGPVDAPYVAVTPKDRSKLPSMVGTKLYAR